METENTGGLGHVKIDFSEDQMWIMNICLAIIMFGVAISINTQDFKEIIKNPKGIVAGVSSQFLLFPALTFLLVLLLKPDMGLALGMILIAACPGGNVSNFFSLQSKGNIALSVSLTVIATLLAPIMTPFNFEFWGSKLAYVQPLFKTISIDYIHLTVTVLQIMVVPLLLGMFISHQFPKVAKLLSKPLQIISILILLAFIFIAFAGNLDIFKNYWHHVVYLVLIHNGIALALGFLYGKYLTKSLKDAKTISIETGIQNGGLGLVIVFTFFDGQGGMALMTAWWGIWDIISGLIIAQVYKKWQEANTSTLT